MNGERQARGLRPSEDDQLEYTRVIRRQFVDHMLANGIPTDPKEQTLLLTALSDMDRSALGQKRIGVNEQQVAADALVARTIAELSSRLDSNPFASQHTRGQLPETRLQELPECRPVPGELDVGISDLCFKDLTKLMEPQD